MTHTTNSTIDFTSTKLKVWWQGLPQEEKQKICRLDAPGIMSDLANAANNALVVCKLNHTYKKKDLISWTKSKSQDATTLISQTFAFNFVGKEVLNDCLAELFSCFYIFITRCRKPEEFSDNEGQSCPSEPKSHIGVNEERLDSLLDFLSHSICNFGDGRKPLIQKKDSSELYFSLINDSSHQLMFSNTTLHAYLKVLLERLTVYSFLLEHQIYTAYFEATTFILDQAVLVREQERVEQSIINQLVSLSPLVSATPLAMKTVSQLEKESSTHELSIDQNSTASGSPRNPIALATPQNLNLEELSQKLLQKSPKGQSTCSTVRELSYSEHSNEMKVKIHEELVPHNYRKNSAIPVWNEIRDPTMFVYEGCLVGNLQVTFDIMDLPLMEDDEPSFENEQEEQRDFGIIEYNELFDVVSQQENGDEDDEKEGYQTEPNEGMHSNLNSFNMPSGPMMNFQQIYPGQQPYLYANSDFYSSYCVQQSYTMMPYNYTAPLMYMPSLNTMDSSHSTVQNDSSYYQQSTYTAENTYYSQTQQRQDSQIHYDNDNSYYQTQKFGENYKNEYEGHHQGQGDEKNYFAGRDKSRYDTRPKLPPRFQKRKENMLRT